MGDYTVLIITAGLKKIPDDKLKEFEGEVLDRMPLNDSAYQASAPTIALEQWFTQTRLSLITQAKYSRGISEFLDWLRPMVVQGIGSEDVWATYYTEYCSTPQTEKLNDG